MRAEQAMEWPAQEMVQVYSPASVTRQLPRCRLSVPSRCCSISKRGSVSWPWGPDQVTLVDSNHSPATDIIHTISAGSPGHTVTFFSGDIILMGDSGEAGTHPLRGFSECGVQ